MIVRFQADADLNHIIVKATLRREPSIDFQTAHAAHLAGVRDQEVLAQTVREIARTHHCPTQVTPTGYGRDRRPSRRPRPYTSNLGNAVG